MDSSLLNFTALVRRWWWLALLGMLVGGAVGYTVNARETPIYRSSVMLRIDAPQPANSFNPQTAASSESLARTYRQVVWNHEVLDPVIEDMQLPYDLDELRDRVFAWTIAGTPILEINVEDTDSERAAGIANAIGDSLIAHVGSVYLADSEPARTAMDEKLQATGEQINDVSSQIVLLQQMAAQGDVGAEAQIAPLQREVERLNQIYIDLQRAKNEMDVFAATSASPISVSTAAEAMANPIEPQPRVALMFGAALRFFLAASIAVLLGFMDKTVKSHMRLDDVLDVPLLGWVGKEPAARNVQGALFVAQSPYAYASEQVRALRANITLQFSREGRKRLAICGPIEDAGINSIAANLAVASAQAGLRTVLIDANIEQPTQHRLFSMPNDTGLSTWLKYSRRSQNGHRDWYGLARKTFIDNLLVIPSGPSTDVPSDLLLGRGNLCELLSIVEREADLVLIDTPPVLESNDAILVAAESEGVVMVCRLSHTEVPDVRRAADVLKPTTTPIVGVVMSEVRGNWKGRSIVPVTDKENLATSLRPAQISNVADSRELANSAD